jgi:hypothetical protein
MNESAPRYWFPAKRYGWGWGFPITWEGWAVFAAVAALVAAGVWFLEPDEQPLRFIAYGLTLAAVLVAVCWWKGEPPRWRWGD